MNDHKHHTSNPSSKSWKLKLAVELIREVQLKATMFVDIIAQLHVCRHRNRVQMLCLSAQDKLEESKTLSIFLVCIA